MAFIQFNTVVLRIRVKMVGVRAYLLNTTHVYSI